MSETKQIVVFVHGLYMTGLELSWMRQHVGEAGFETRQFHYHSVLERVPVNAHKLADYIAGFTAKTLHLVGHSLGGLVILRMFDLGAEIPPGRVVLLGAPVNGSFAARKLAAKHLGWVLGQSGVDGLLEEHTPQWSGRRELGVIAGTGGFGVNPYRPDLPGPHDGLVTVAETRMVGAADYDEVGASHMGLLFSSAVADQVVTFLTTGAFVSQTCLHPRGDGVP